MMPAPLLTTFSFLLLGTGVIILYFYPDPIHFLLYNGALFALIMLDYFLLPRNNNFKIERHLDNTVSIRKKQSVIIEVKVKKLKKPALLQKNWWLKVRDEPPVAFCSNPREITLLPEGFSPYKAYRYRGEYFQTPGSRGDHYYGKLNLRCRGPLGLCWGQYAFRPNNNYVKVYPQLNISASKEMQVPFSLLRQSGLRSSRMVSTGTEFESLREYVSDDDPRQINWKASARKGSLVSIQHQAEKSQNLILVFEAGRMMLSETSRNNTEAENSNITAYGYRMEEVNNLSKLDHALHAGLTLGHAALTYGDQVGAMTFAEEVGTYLPPASRYGQIRKIIKGVYRLQPRRLEPDYQRALIYLSHRQKKRSLICIFSDLIDTGASANLIESILALGKKHLILFVAMGDRFLPSTVAEKTRRLDDVYRKAAAQQYLLERQQGLNYLRNRGIEVLELLPYSDPVKLVGRYLEIKSKYRL